MGEASGVNGQKLKTDNQGASEEKIVKERRVCEREHAPRRPRANDFRDKIDRPKEEEGKKSGEKSGRGEEPKCERSQIVGRPK